MGVQNTNYKEATRILQSDMLGKHRRIGPLSFDGTLSWAAGARGNYALRTDWLCADKLRAVLGKYYTVYNRPANFPGQQNIKNYGVLDSSTPGWNWNQVKNAPLTFDVFSTSTAGPRYFIRLNNFKWNALAHNSDTDDFLRDIEYGNQTAGNPNWRFFLQGITATEISNGVTISSRFNGVTPVFQNPGPFRDNTFFYWKPSNIAPVRADSGMMINVASTYNFYADTTPPYEDAISTLPEPLLPNFYCIESELRNTGSTPNNFDYIRQIKMHYSSRVAPGTSLNPNYLRDNFPLDDWFDEVTSLQGVPAGWTESTGDEFYSLYAASANSVANSSQMNNIYDDSAEFKNCVILCSDLEGLNKLAAGDTKSTGLVNVPFYNTLTLGLDLDAMSPGAHGTLGNDNFFSKLKAVQYNGQPETFKSFMDILQMYIIQKIEAAIPGSLHTYKKWKKAPALSPAGSIINNWTVTDASDTYSSDFSWKEFMKAWYQSAPERAVVQDAVDRINATTSPQASDNLLLLRDYNSKFEEDPLLVDADVADCFPVFAANTNGNIAYPTRNFNSVLRGDSCYSEPILYKIDKSLIPPGGGTGQVVQTFYISARDGDWSQPLGGINYIDTQIKYGRKYTYDIKQIRLVYGNDYKYENLQLYYTNVPADDTQGIGRALGIYRDPGLSRWNGQSPGPESDEVTDDIITALVDPDAYTDWNENPLAASEQESYFIFRPEEQASWATHAGGTAYTDTMFQYTKLFNDGTSFEGALPPNNQTAPAVFSGFGTTSPDASLSSNVLDGIKMRVLDEDPDGPAGDQMVGAKLEYFENVELLERPPIVPTGTQSIPISSGGSQSTVHRLPGAGGVGIRSPGAGGAHDPGQSGDGPAGTPPPPPPGSTN